MKVMKAMKKLKFWSWKKRKLKQASPSSQAQQCSCEYSAVSPPLPFWFNETLKLKSVCAPEASASPWTTQLPHKQEEPIVQIKPWSQVSDLRSSRSYSNQQCVVPNPAFGVPIVVAVPAKRLLGTFGCVIGLSSNVVRCLFPCFST